MGFGFEQSRHGKGGLVLIIDVVFPGQDSGVDVWFMFRFFQPL